MGKTTPLNLINKYRSAIMGVIAIWIVFHHAWLILTPENNILHDLEELITISGYTGVDIFLLLSGMGLYYAIQKYDIKTFYKRRFSRILPPFLTFALVVAIVDKWTIMEFVQNITGYNFYTKNIHSFLWFVIAIMTLYLLFTLYYKLFDKTNNKKKFTAIVLLVWFIVSVMVVNILRPDLFQFTHRIPIFLIGILFGWMEEYEEIVFNKYHWVNCIIALLTGFLLIYLKINVISIAMGVFVVIGSHFTIPAILIAISGTLLLAKVFQLISINKNKLGQILIKLLSLIGSISFELYIVQQWIVEKLNIMWEKQNISNLTINIINIALIFIATLILKLFITYLKILRYKIRRYVKTAK